MQMCGERGIIIPSGSAALRLSGTQAFAFLISSVTAGTMSKRLPMRPTSAISKMGASASLLMATMVRRFFHADDVLDGSADAEGQIELGGDGLAGAANLAVEGQPAVIADGSARLRVLRRGLAPGPPARATFFCSLMPRPTATMTLRLREIDRLLRLLKDLVRVTWGGPFATAAITFSMGSRFPVSA